MRVSSDRGDIRQWFVHPQTAGRRKKRPRTFQSYTGLLYDKPCRDKWYAALGPKSETLNPKTSIGKPRVGAMIIYQ